LLHGAADDREEPTLVTFTLEDAPGNGTLPKVVESGFDRVPPHRRAEAFRMNSRGWDGQMKNIVRHVTGSAKAAPPAPSQAQ
jgi:hypothetical protein